MNNEEWQAKYTQMSILYQECWNRLKHTEDMLAKAMEMNLKLVGMLQDNRVEEKFNKVQDKPAPTWEGNPPVWDGRAAGQCAVCGIKGVNGYVCQNTACPNRVTNISTTRI